MKLKLLLLTLLFYVQIYSQTHIKDYFIPEGKNKSVFYMPTSSGENGGLETEIWFVDRGKSFEILESNSLNGTTTSMTNSTFDIHDDKVILKKSVSTSLLVKISEKYFSPPQIYLKLPTENKKTNWKFTNELGDKYNCTSEFSTVEIDGQTKKSIRVTKQIISKDPQVVEIGSTVEQYVLGIGLWQKKAQNGVILKVLKDQILDPTVDQSK